MKHPERDFRKDHYWHIRNYNAFEKLPRSVHAKAMSRVQKSRVLEEFTRHLGQEFSYRIADKFCSGREGHCFGMSVAAVKEWHERGAQAETKRAETKRKAATAMSSGEPKQAEGSERRRSVTEVGTLSQKMREEILTLHLKQMEPDYLGYVVRLFAKRLLFASEWSMKLIAELIDREGCVLVNVVDVKKLAGHTVVAYDYHKDPKTGDYMIYVADSNHPWSEAEEGRHPSCIRLMKSSDGKKIAGLYYRNRCDGRYEVVFGVPYKYIR